MTRTLLKYFFVLIVFLLTTQNLNSQQITLSEGSPEWLIQMFFKSESFPEKEKYFTGEMIEEINNASIGEELNGKGEIDFYQFSSTDERKAFAINLKVNSADIDFYCYLINSDGWKIEAVRRFLFPKFIYVAADSLSHQKNLSIADSSMWKLLKLMTGTDHHLKNYFSRNVEKFQDLLKYFDENNSDEIEKLINELSLNGIFKDDAYPGCIFVQIADLEGREVGYIFKSGDTALPKISPKRFIYIAEVLADWYIYRLIKI